MSALRYVVLLAFGLVLVAGVSPQALASQCARQQLVAFLKSNKPLRPLYENTPVPIARRSLSHGAAPKLSDVIEANSEQRQPVFLGARRAELALGKGASEAPRIPAFMKALGEKHAELVRKKLGLDALEFEMWPAWDTYDRLTWAVARWRKTPEDSWKWIDLKKFEKQAATMEPQLVLPRKVNPASKTGFAEIFDDFVLLDSPYSKPIFGDTVWTTQKGEQLLAAWPEVDQIAEQKALMKDVKALKSVDARVLPQPSRFNSEPKTFTVRVEKKKVHWPEEIKWEEPPVIAKPVKSGVPAAIAAWDPEFATKYRADVEIIAGEKEAVFPLSGRRTRFLRKNAGDPEHQILEMVEYLEERYKQLGIKTFRQEFEWREIPQANLVAVIKGSESGAGNRPILLVDHMDTAIDEKTFADFAGKRVSVPGADDNATAVAALLRAAEALKDSKPKSDIWLVHMTAEEFPGDCLGAREFVQKMVREKRNLGGVLVMDMIGHYPKTAALIEGKKVFQLSVGDGLESLAVGAAADEAARMHSKQLMPMLRARHDTKSYLSNTDALIFSESGYPTVLFNEWLNRKEYLFRSGYHDMTDTTANLDWEYAEGIVKTVIETAQQLGKR